MTGNKPSANQQEQGEEKEWSPLNSVQVEMEEGGTNSGTSEEWEYK
jgi:hypothetical protein